MFCFLRFFALATKQLNVFVLHAIVFARSQHEEPHRPCTYARNDRSMQHIAYDCAYFVAEKVGPREPEAGSTELPVAGR